MALQLGRNLWGPTTSQLVFLKAQVFYPFLLLTSFGIVFAIHSVIASQHQEDVEKPSVTGPGGKPLPVTRIKADRTRYVPAPIFQFSKGLHVAFRVGTYAIVLTFVCQVGYIFIQCMRADWADIGRFTNDELLTYILGGVFFWTFLGTSLESKQLDKPDALHFSMWCIGLAYELILLSIYLTAFPYRINTPQSEGKQFELREQTPRTIPFDPTYLSVSAIRICLLTCLVIAYSCVRGFIPRPRWAHKNTADPEAALAIVDEASPLLINGHTSGLENGHGQGQTTPVRSRRRTSESRRANGATKGCRQKQTEFAFYRPDKLPHRSWWEYLRGYHIFFPYLWPAKDTNLKMLVMVCFVLVILQRAVNVMVPIALGWLVLAMGEQAGKGGSHMPWKELFLFLGLKLMQGQSGLFGSLRAMLWIPVTQHSYMSLQTAAFEHVHSLSLEFHLGKRTGELLSALNKGGSVNQFLEQTTFQVAPTLLDLFVAIGFFWVKFGPLYALCATVITFSYLVLTIQMASTRADQRRDMVNADREEEAIKNDSITAYETVKYFNAEKFEFNRYRKAIQNFQGAEKKVVGGLNMMNMCQTALFTSGMFVVMSIAAYEVVLGRRDIAEFVMVLTYLNQLQGPLNFFGSFYRTVQQAMISGERLLELFKIQPNIIDKPSAKPLVDCQGNIKWTNVDFNYQNTPALRDLSFECTPGTTTALVGESGGGKSTVFRVMFRYFGHNSGSIQIDGNEIDDITVDSLRRAIGVVPQETILFNETILYNLKYANQEATMEEIIDACQAASIHDRIMSFPDKYNTRVGERGMRLSGGEKQRLSIARTILKKPRIIMLDEATSALDSETEQQIQAKLFRNREVGKGKTLLVIAHRLSTITHAEQILVLHKGRIIERGTHAELLGLKGGKYASMWEKQAKAELATKAAAVAKQEARRARKEAGLSSGKDSSDEHSDDCGESQNPLTAPATPAVEIPGLLMTPQ